MILRYNVSIDQKGIDNIVWVLQQYGFADVSDYCPSTKKYEVGEEEIQIYIAHSGHYNDFSQYTLTLWKSPRNRTTYIPYGYEGMFQMIALILDKYGSAELEGTTQQTTKEPNPTDMFEVLFADEIKDAKDTIEQLFLSNKANSLDGGK